ncbi:MAG: T9SS type A sorting domain-containing protein, partial [Cytophagales bacterium]|nr:T9SS type A sorting domain-containing protein [Cytophaga sp.]
GIISELGRSFHIETVIKNNNIGFNKENGISCTIYSTNDLGIIKIIQNNIGGDGTASFKNGKYGIKTFGSSVITENNIFDNDSGGVYVSGKKNILSKNLFNGSPRAIYFSNDTANLNKQGAVFTGKIPTPTSLTFSGIGITNDVVEFFVSSSIPQTALKYVGSVVVQNGSWKFVIPKGIYYDPAIENIYVNTATDNVGGTSMLSNNSNNLHLLLPKVNLCYGDSVQADALIDNAAYTWKKDGVVVSTIKNPYFKAAGNYTLEVIDAFSNSIRDTMEIVFPLHPLKADFLMASVAGVEDKTVAVDISFAKPDSVSWNWGSAVALWDQDKYLITFPSVGIYTIKLLSYLGYCSSSTQHDITIKPGSMGSPDGIVYPYTIKNVTGAPNPVAEVLSIKADLANEDVITLYVYSTQGTLIFTYTTPEKKYAHSYELDMTGYGSGEYLIRVSSGQDERLLRIIKL